jgi:hypothetical protein
VNAELRGKVDAVLDQLGDDDSVAQPLVDLLDAEDAWHWHGGRRMTDRGAIVEATGAFYCVTSIDGQASATRHATFANADREMDAIHEDL